MTDVDPFLEPIKRAGWPAMSTCQDCRWFDECEDAGGTICTAFVKASLAVRAKLEADNG